MGRSGTTLLRLMLDSHSTLAIPAETDFAPALEAFEKGGPRAAVDAMIGSRFWNDYGMPAVEFTQRVTERAPATVSEVLRTFFELYAERKGKVRWGNKTPYHLVSMQAVQELLPEAHFVHIVRDGRDVALSTAPLWFGANDVAGVAQAWSHSLQTARHHAPALSRYVEVRYEDLIRDPASSLRRICEFLDLDWEPSMLDYHERAAERLSELGNVSEAGRYVPAEERVKIWALVSSPPQLDRVERWKREMSPADIREFQAIAGETLLAFGYELD